jgi:hypothetical protein
MLEVNTTWSTRRKLFFFCDEMGIHIRKCSVGVVNAGVSVLARSLNGSFSSSPSCLPPFWIA